MIYRVKNGLIAFSAIAVTLLSFQVIADDQAPLDCMLIFTQRLER